MLRGDIARLGRCVNVTTGSTSKDSELIPRSKPFKYTYEKEIVLYVPISYLVRKVCLAQRRYAYFKKLDYFSTECIYSPNAYRGYARTFLKDLEKMRPSAIIGVLPIFSNALIVLKHM